MRRIVLSLFWGLLAIRAMASYKVDGVYYVFDESTMGATVVGLYDYAAPYNNKSYSGEVIIPEHVTWNKKVYTVKAIGNYAFYGCDNLTGVKIPNSVEEIGVSAFCSCYNITEMTLPNSVTSIFNDAFYGCGFQKITLSNNLSELGDRLFFGCPNLQTIIIPDNVGVIGKETFRGCSSLKSVIFSINLTSIGESAFRDCISLDRIVIPNSLTNMGDRVFMDCSGMKAITLSNNMADISIGAFSGCISLESVQIPESVTSIGSSAFLGCTSLTEITIPDKLSSIGSYAFASCTSLVKANIPHSLTVLSNSLFYGCNCLSDIIIPQNITSIEEKAFMNCGLVNVSIPNSVVSIGNMAFTGCTNLKTAVIPNSIKDLPQSLFYDCSNLTDITIPQSITSIGSMAFGGCSSIKSISLPENVNSVGRTAFNRCTSLTNMFCYSIQVPTTDDDIFYYSSVKNASLHVPSSSVNAYKSTYPWNQFKEILPLVDGDVNGDCVTNATDIVEIVNYMTNNSSTSFDKVSADKNGDGSVNVADIVSFVNSIIGSGNNNISFTKCPDENHPHIIDLNLPSGIKWACCNIGANAPEKYGTYFAWGETQEKSYYSWATYAYWNDSEGDGSPEYGQTGAYREEFDYIVDDISGTQYDAATIQWGNPWRMPTNDNFLELLEHTTSSFTTVNGFDGYSFTGSNGGTIFLPYAESIQNDKVTVDYTGLYTMGHYWSSTPDPDNDMMGAWSLILDYGRTFPPYTDRRSPWVGYSIRPIY